MSQKENIGSSRNGAFGSWLLSALYGVNGERNTFLYFLERDLIASLKKEQEAFAAILADQDLNVRRRVNRDDLQEKCKKADPDLTPPDSVV